MEDSEPGTPLVSLCQGEEEAPPRPAEGGQEEVESSLDEHIKQKDLAHGAFKAGKFLIAIEAFTQALRLLPDTASQEAIELTANRSAAYASLSRQYLTRPANRSESAALYGPDPGCLNARALADAQKVLAARPQWAKAHSLMGTALLLSEKYDEAREAFQKGLQLTPDNKACKDGLKAVAEAVGDEEDEVLEEQQVEQQQGESAQPTTPWQPQQEQKQGAQAEGCGGAISDSQSPPFTSKRARVTRALSQHADECECTLCLKLLFEPVTTPCGHSFCRACLMRALDHRSRCPMCRTVLHVGAGQLPVTLVLQRILQRSFPEEYAERAKEEEAAAMRDTEAGAAITLKLPLFVMTTIMPGERIALNIFEPRYRLLLRRAMEGNRRLGMAEVSLGGELQDVAVEAEVVEYAPQPDGRYFVELSGRRRVKIQDCHDLDGYRMASAEVIEHDDYPAEGSPEAAALTAKATEVLHGVMALVEQLTRLAARSSARPGRIQELIAHAGPRPTESSLRTPQGAEALSFWAAAFGGTLALGLDRCKLLRMRSTYERLEAIQASLP
uniref:RING-type domain-containing protein n=1 Tax=Dunaliella tertiolecta TaxID=3047 RepID=A0A6S8L0E2_DUNTE|mmetsp:Transcript_16928/g.46789  ORF Transcript_16928/g.46789 Transcript_16928/m.46789 type:complete len:556 (-) Transcript_16928:1179-2846(-)